MKLSENAVDIKDIFFFMTGMKSKPLLPSEKNSFGISVEFEHDCNKQYGEKHTTCYPIVSTCSVSITLPVIHLTSYDAFKDNMLFAVAAGREFGRG